MSDFLGRFDPTKLSANELAGMCGALRVRVEGARSAEEVFGDLRSRQFFRKLHRKFPYLGFFLKLHPVRSPKLSPALIDASVLVAIGLCHTDFVVAHWDSAGQHAILYQISQFETFVKKIDLHIAAIGRNAGLTAPAIEHRRKVVARTIRSFFRLGSFSTIEKQP